MYKGRFIPKSKYGVIKYFKDKTKIKLDTYQKNNNNN